MASAWLQRNDGFGPPTVVPLASLVFLGKPTNIFFQGDRIHPQSHGRFFARKSCEGTKGADAPIPGRAQIPGAEGASLFSFFFLINNTNMFLIVPCWFYRESMTTGFCYIYNFAGGVSKCKTNILQDAPQSAGLWEMESTSMMQQRGLPKTTPPS